MPFGLQPWHLLIVLVVLVLVMGPKRLPEIGQALGKTLRGFKDELDAKPPEPPATGGTPIAAATTPIAAAAPAPAAIASAVTADPAAPPPSSGA